MAYVTIEEKVSLGSEFIDKDIKMHIYKYILSRFQGKNTEKYGYVIEILPNVEILKNEISTTGSRVNFYVRFGAKTLKPERGKNYTGEVSCVMSEGLFVIVQKDLGVEEEMKVFIPVTDLKDYELDKTVPCFRSKNKVIQEGTILEIVITKIKQETKRYIGSLKNC